MNDLTQTNLDMIGIDVSKDKLDIYILSTNKYVCIKNQYTKILSWLKQQPENVSYVFESTGGYEKSLIKCLNKVEASYHRAHPNRVFHYGKSKGYFAKTDKIDAKILASYGRDNSLAFIKISEKNLQLQELSSRKTQLKKMLQQERHRLGHDFFNSTIKQSIKRHIKQIEKEINEIDTALEQAIDDNQEMTEKRELLESVKGVGKEVSQILLTQLPELGKLSKTQISSLVGVAPCNRDSGKKNGRRSVRGGRFDVRRALYMSALVAIRHNKYYKEKYHSLLNRGKEKKVALMAIMRKLIMALNAMIKNNCIWQEA